MPVVSPLTEIYAKGWSHPPAAICSAPISFDLQKLILY